MSSSRNSLRISITAIIAGICDDAIRITSRFLSYFRSVAVTGRRNSLCISVPTIITGICDDAIRITGCFLSYFGSVAVTECRDFFGVGVSTIFAGICHFSRLCTGGLFGYNAFPVGVPSRGNYFCADHFSAGCTPVSNLTRFCAGSLFRDHTFVLRMTKCGDFFGVGVPTVFTGVGPNACLCASCFLCYRRSITVSSRRHFLGICFSTNLAGMSHLTRFRAGRLFCNDPIIVGVSNGRDLFRPKNLTAAVAAISDLASFCTGRLLCDHAFIFSVSKCRDFFFIHMPTYLTGRSLQSGFCTGRLGNHNFFPVSMVLCCRNLFRVSVIAYRTGIGLFTGFSTGGFLSYHAGIFMPQSRDFLGLCLAAGSTGVGHFARFRACCFPGHYAIVICMDVDFISFFCRAALIGRVPMIGSVPFIIC